MKQICEIIVKEILPSMKALLTLELMEEHGLSQKEIAEKLDITQPSVSQYKNQARGAGTKFIEKSKFGREIEEMASKVAEGEAKGVEVSLFFCRICKEMRKEGLLCESHREVYPEMEKCDLCLT